MSDQITVTLSAGITALVTYTHLKPFNINFDPYSGEKGEYVADVEGEKIVFTSLASLLTWLDRQRADIVCPAKIQRVTLLKEKYNRKAVELTGSDFRAIQNAVDAIPPYKYPDAEAMALDLMPQYD